ncbi:hypothetical protein ACKC9G_14485 [Pokkaliibacter sp. CJK22405]|uniref:hypothetical protein n=1 Tax=Pokkaliibacter sp. CJK22405 TaxID=3384615 RepID=UPI00398548B9
MNTHNLRFYWMIGLVVGIITLLVCTRSWGESAASCKQVSLYGVDNQGVVIKPALIGPEYISSISSREAENPGESSLLDMTLTKAGSYKLHNYTQSHIGKALAVYCGDKEVTRPFIMAPISGQLRITVPPKEGI